VGNKNPDETLQEGSLDRSLKFWALLTSFSPEPNGGFAPDAQDRREWDFKHFCYCMAAACFSVTDFLKFPARGFG